MSQFKIGDKIITFHDFSNPDSFKEGTITKINKEFVWLDNKHSSEDCIYLAFCWPYRVADELKEIIKERARLKKVFDDSMGVIYQLSNAIKRGEK